MITQIFSIQAANVEFGQTESDQVIRDQEKHQISVSEPENNDKSELRLQMLETLTSVKLLLLTHESSFTMFVGLSVICESIFLLVSQILI